MSRGIDKTTIPFLEKLGYGKETNFTTDLVASLMLRYADSLVENNGVLDDVINCDKCGGEVLYDEEYKSTFCNRCYQG